MVLCGCADEEPSASQNWDPAFTKIEVETGSGDIKVIGVASPGDAGVVTSGGELVMSPDEDDDEKIWFSCAGDPSSCGASFELRVSPSTTFVAATTASGNVAVLDTTETWVRARAMGGRARAAGVAGDLQIYSATALVVQMREVGSLKAEAPTSTALVTVPGGGYNLVVRSEAGTETLEGIEHVVDAPSIEVSAGGDITIRAQ